MSGKTRVDVERVRALREELRQINQLELDQIEWFENGQPMNVRPEAVKEFSFIGLNNADFIEFVNPETGLLNVVDDNEEENNDA